MAGVNQEITKPLEPEVTLLMSGIETIVGSHEFKITGFSLSKGVGIGNYISSDTFVVGGHTWAIYFYPDGRCVEDDSNYISVFVALVSESTDVRALFELILFDQSGRRRHHVSSNFIRSLGDAPYTLKQQGSMWGLERYFRRTALEASNYLKDDCLKLHCRVGVVNSHAEGPKIYSVPLPPSDIGQHFGKLLESGKGTDGNFEKTSSAHKLGVAAQSPELRAQLHGPMNDKDSRCMKAEDRVASDSKKMKMDPFLSLMREVALKENVSEQPILVDALGCTDILMKSEKLIQRFKQADETNAMDAVELYGEQAILAIELRELQSRVLSLSIGRDKYLAVLDEMQQTLNVRLAEAQNVIKSAEQEKVEKENAVMKSLIELKLITKKVMKESRSLSQVAEDNAKLREFLVDRGRVVDMLQGEITAICEDVRLLNNKLDEQIPSSKSLSSNQNSRISASSGSGSKSLIPEQVVSLPHDGVDPMDTQKKEGIISCSTKDEAIRGGDKALSDEEWEMLDRV